MATKKKPAKKAPAKKTTKKPEAKKTAPVKKVEAPKVEAPKAEAPKVEVVEVVEVVIEEPEETGPFVLKTWMDGSPANFVFDTKAERDALHSELCGIVAAGQTAALKTARSSRKERKYVTINKIHDPSL